MAILEYLEEISDGRWERGYIINGKPYYINISTIMAVYNPEAIEFLKENYPIHKIILSREVTLKEFEEISAQFPDLLFEMFGEGDFCRYNNGLCFAEHKYTDRDICTVVVNDLIVKKAINYDYRKIIQDENLSNNEKAAKFDNEYKNEFEKLEDLLEDFVLTENENLLEEMKKLVQLIVQKYWIFYDPLQGVNTVHNKNFKILLDVVRLLKEKNLNIS
jgi:collagenase-like PrtC family protease